MVLDGLNGLNSRSLSYPRERANFMMLFPSRKDCGHLVRASQKILHDMQQQLCWPSKRTSAAALRSGSCVDLLSAASQHDYSVAARGI